MPSASGAALGSPERAPFQRGSYFDNEFRNNLGYAQPASPLASVGIMASAPGAADSASLWIKVLNAGPSPPPVKNAAR